MKYNKVRNIIKETINRQGLLARGDSIVMGVSGGPDSICLFDVLADLAPEWELKLYPVHINHCFRPGAAEADQDYTERFTAGRGFPCESRVVDCSAMASELGMTSEEAGRKARYDAFYDRCRRLAEEGVDRQKIKIAVAHNANDQVETVLFRILRGTGTDGLTGMEYSRREGEYSVVRPLLDVRREDIEEYCECKGLNPARDHTNEEAIYARNKIRLELLPYLEREYNENIAGALLRLRDIAASDKEFIRQSVGAAMERLRLEGDGEVVLERQGLAELHEAIRHRVVMKAFGEVGLTSDITAERLAAADRIIMKKQGPKTVEFPGGYRLKVAAGKVHIGKHALDKRCES